MTHIFLRKTKNLLYDMFLPANISALETDLLILHY